MKGIKRQIDRLGRVVIPISYRKFLNLSENSNVNIYLEDNTIVITPSDKRCSLCGDTSHLHQEISLCEKFIESIKKLS